MNWLFLMTVILVLTMMTFAFVIRYFVHLERMALIRQGIIPPAMATPIFRRGSFGLLIAGLVTLFSGCGLLLGLYLGLGISFLAGRRFFTHWSRPCTHCGLYVWGTPGR